MPNLIKGHCLICLVMDTSKLRESAGEERGIEVCHDHKLDLREGKLSEALVYRALQLLKEGAADRPEDAHRGRPRKADAAQA